MRSRSTCRRARGSGMREERRRKKKKKKLGEAKSMRDRWHEEEEDEEKRFGFALLFRSFPPLSLPAGASLSRHRGARECAVHAHGDNRSRRGPLWCKRGEKKKRRIESAVAPLQPSPLNDTTPHLWAPRRRPRRVLRQRERLQGPKGPPSGFPRRGGGVQQLLERGRGPVASSSSAAAAETAAANATEASSDASWPHGRERLQVRIR